MALILLKQHWIFTSAYVDPNDSRISGNLYHAEKWEFNTVTRTVIYTPYPDGGYWDEYTGEGLPGPPPPEFSRDPAEEFHVYVSGPNRIGYHHDGVGGLTLDIKTLTLTATVVGCTCWGAHSGLIDLALAGLPGPYTVLWDDGVTTEDRAAVGAGTYTVTVQDNPTGAVAQTSVVVGQNPELLVTLSKAGGDVTLQVSGGVGPYTYLWSDGATTRDRAGLVTGPYTCTITDSLGCQKVLQVLVDTNQFYWSRNPITLALDAGPAYRTDPSTKPSLTFLCEVWVEKEYLSGVFEQVGTAQEQPADRLGRTVFEVQALLDVFLDWHLPALNQLGWVRADPLFRRFYLKYAESYGTPAARSGTVVLAQAYVLKGGLNFYEQQARTWQSSYQQSIRPFLTWEPPVKPALLDQPEYLYYQVQPPVGGIRLRVRLHYADGSTRVITRAAFDAVLQHEVYCAAVGYTQLLLNRYELPSNPIRAWEVFVTATDLTTVLSEVRRYDLDRRHFPRRRFFLFATSLGGMATFAAVGEAQIDAEVKGDEVTLALAPDYDPLRGDTLVQERTLRPVVKVASSFRTRAQQEAAQDLLLSRRVLLLSRVGRWLPGYLKAKTTTLLDESKAVPTLEFEFYLPTERLFTPFLDGDQVTYATPSLP